jgi:urease accessory protein
MLALTRTISATALLATSVAAGAHTGHAAHGLAAGLVHPLAADHLLAVLAVGLLAAADTRWLRAPLVFLAALAAGALAGLGGVLPAPGEAAIAASVLMFGLLLLAPRLPARQWALTAVAGAALLHGLAHGTEWPATAAFAPHATGLLLGTTLLLGLALLAGRRLLSAHAHALRLAGLCTGLAGIALLAAA